MISLKRYKLAATTHVSTDLFRAFFLVIPALITRSVMWALIASVVFLFMRVCAVFSFLCRSLEWSTWARIVCWCWRLDSWATMKQRLSRQAYMCGIADLFSLCAKPVWENEE